jgi:hypothetical protein
MSAVQDRNDTYTVTDIKAFCNTSSETVIYRTSFWQVTLQKRTHDYFAEKWGKGKRSYIMDSWYNKFNNILSHINLFFKCNFSFSKPTARRANRSVIVNFWSKRG